MDFFKAIAAFFKAVILWPLLPQAQEIRYAFKLKRRPLPPVLKILAGRGLFVQEWKESFVWLLVTSAFSMLAMMIYLSIQAIFKGKL